ncbi:MAG: hydroxymethylpyrimidine/phosphomethylpyrimidine kinase [Gammaproteobacteria bacterium]|nr:hydroxymethylpyrimidine/phosphomethylpyrimidine kinase [Gammaproteobacteria bacterium]
MHAQSRPPIVLVIGGNDPSGGAGLTADIQSVSALGGHPAPVVSAITVQDTVNAQTTAPVPPALIVEQARALFADMPVAAIKLGLIASAEAAQSLAYLLASHRQLPLVVDPVLAAGGGMPFADDALVDAYLKLLAPLATIITPNTAESHRLAPQAADGEARAAALLALGCRHVLIKGADEQTTDVHNTLFSRDGSTRHFTWPRMPGSYHGSGCTLASAIATLLGLGHTPLAAVEIAQRYTWEAVRQAWKLGKGQRIPNRQAKS